MVPSFMTNRWETMEIVTDFIFLGSKITANDCSREIKRCLFLRRKVMTNLESILKSRDILTKVCLVKAMVFPVVRYGCECWTIKNTEHWRINPFELWCWRRFLRVPWTARRSNEYILMGISTEYSLEGPMLKLKLQYLVTWCKELTGKDPNAGKDWRQENWTIEDEMVGRHYQLSGHEFEQTPGVGDGQRSRCAAVHGVTEIQTELLHWTEFVQGFPGGTSGKEHACQCRRQKRLGFNLLCVHRVV